MEDLKKIFETEKNKRFNIHTAYVQSRIDLWNKDLKACEKIFNALSFLNESMFIEKVCCTPYDYSNAQGGFFPYLRISPTRISMPTIIKPLHDSQFVLKVDIGGMVSNGSYTLETFVKELGKNLKFV